MKKILYYIIFFIIIISLFILISKKYESKRLNELLYYSSLTDLSDEVIFPELTQKSIDLIYVKEIKEPIKLINIEKITNKWTFLCWIIPKLIPNKSFIMISKGKTLIYYDSKNNRIKFVLTNPSGKFESKSKIEELKPSIDKDIHVAWIQNNDNTIIYINGRRYITSDIHQDFTQIISSSEPFKSKTNYSNFEYKNVRIYHHKALSDDEIKKIYESESSQKTKPKELNHNENGRLYTKESEIIII